MTHRDSPPSFERSAIGVRRAIRDHHAMVYRVAFGVVGNAADAEDIVQATFLALVRRHSSIRDDAALPAWLARVAVNEARQWIRGETRRRGREAEVAKARRGWVGSDEERAMSRDEVREAVERLPEELRTPLLLHYVEGLQYREIAEVLACSEGAVAKRLHSGRQKLERRLAPLGALAPLPRLLGEAAPKVPVGLEERVVLSVESAAAMAAAGTVGVGSSSRFIWSAVSAVALVALTTVWTLQPDPVTHAGRGDVGASDAVAESDREAGARGAPAAERSSRKIDDLVHGFLSRSEPEAGVARVTGRVVDGDGTPMAGVPVTLELVQDGSVSTRVDRTDEDGRYDFLDIDLSRAAPGVDAGSAAETGSDEVAATNWARHKPPFLGQTMSFSGTRATVRVSLDGFRSVEDGAFLLSDGIEIERTHVMETAARIVGRVVDPDGKPIRGAEVWLRGGTAEERSDFSRLLTVDRRSLTDETGRFVLPRVGIARYLLEARAPGFGSAERLADANGDEVTLTLARCGQLELRVDHSAERRPIANARVGLFRDGRSFGQGVTGPDGAARFEAAAGDYELAVFRNDFPVAIEPVSLVAGQEVQHRVRVDDGIALTIEMSETPRQVGAHLQAVLRPEWSVGTAHASVGVRPSSYSLAWGPHEAVRFVDRSGSVRFEGLVPGRYVFEVRGVDKGRRSFDLVTEVIEIGPAPRETIRRVEFVEIERGRISVTTFNADGAPEGFPVIRAERVNAIGSVAARLGKDGQASLAVTAGEYRVTVNRPGAPPYDLGEVDVRPGETRSFEVTLDPVDPDLVFDLDRQLWLAGDVPYAGVVLLLDDLATASSSAIDPSLDLTGRRVTWGSQVSTAEFLQSQLRYLGLHWEVRSGQLVWSGR